MFRRILIAALTVFLLAACSSAGNTAEGTNTNNPAPTSALPTPENAAPGASGVGDPYFPGFGNSGYDVQHYLIDLEVDMDNNEIAGRTLITALATQDLDQMNLDFIGLSIARVLVNGEEISYQRQSRELILNIPPIAEGQQFEIEIAYSGVPGKGIDSSELDAFELGWVYYGDGVYVAGEPSGSSTWYPVNEHPTDKALYTYEITVEEPYEVAANGSLQDVVAGDGENTFIWSSADPIASYLVTIAIAEFDIEEAIGPNGLLIRNYFGKDIATFVRDDFDRQPEMIALFNDLFGPYPFEAYGVVVHDVGLRFALETQTLSVFGRSFTTEDAVAHELAHSWFGDSVTLADWQNIWLNEGFASYASVLWFENTYGLDTSEDILHDWYSAMAPGEPSYVLSRSELAGAFQDLLPIGAQYSQNQAAEAAQTLLVNLVDQGELNGVIATLNEQVSAGDLASLLRGLSGNEFTMTNSRLAGAFSALAEDELAAEFAGAYPVPGDPSPDDVFSRSVYYRGALTLHALRLEIGDEAFFNTLRAYAERFQKSNASTKDFIAVAEEISGQDLDALFEAWLFQPQIPDIPELDLYYVDFVAQ